MASECQPPLWEESAGSQVLLLMLLLLLLEGFCALVAPSSFHSLSAPAAGSCLHFFQMSQVLSHLRGSVQTPFALEYFIQDSL